MKLFLACITRFHFFNQVQELQRQGYDTNFISTYLKSSLTSPRFSQYELNPEKYISLWWLGVSFQAYLKSLAKLKRIPQIREFFFSQFDQTTTSYINEDYDIFHGWSSMSLECILKCKEKGVISILDRCSAHTINFHQIISEEYEKWGLKYSAITPKLYSKEIEEYKQVDYVLVPSTYVKNTCIEQGISEDRILQVPLGVSLKEFSPQPKEDDVFRVIYCGSINFHKGVQYLLKAFQELNLDNSELWLVGSVAPQFQSFLAKYESDKIIAKGYYPQTQLKFLYSQCSVFCLPSLSDGFGMVLTQAMACGLPIIYTDHTGGPDVARDGEDGFCIPIRNVEAIKEKILYLYENSEHTKQMGQNALKQVQQAVNWQGYGENLAQAYESVLTSPSTSK